MERAPDPGAARARVYVGGDVDRPAVRAALAVPAAVHVAEYLAVVGAHQPRPALRNRNDPPRHLLDARRSISNEIAVSRTIGA